MVVIYFQGRDGIPMIALLLRLELATGRAYAFHDIRSGAGARMHCGPFGRLGIVDGDGEPLERFEIIFQRVASHCLSRGYGHFVVLIKAQVFSG